MARQRDYKAEYARRIATHRERAAREGRPFSLRQARGHTATEPQQRKINRLIRATTMGPKSAANLRIAVKQQQQNGVSNPDIIAALERKQDNYKAFLGGDTDQGHDDYEEREQWWPVEFYYYKGE